MLAMVLTSKRKRALNKDYYAKHKERALQKQRENRSRKNECQNNWYVKNSTAVLRARKKAYLLNSEDIKKAARDNYMCMLITLSQRKRLE